MEPVSLLELATRAKPSDNLAECLRTVEDLSGLAAFHETMDDDAEYDKTKQPDDGLISLLTPCIVSNFEKDVRFFSAVETRFVNETIRCMRENVSWTQSIVPLDFSYLERQGYIYLFSWEDKLWPVFPKELWQFWESAMSDEALLADMRRHQDMVTYAGALVNLYGLLEIEQFVAVWNQHRKDKLSIHEAENILDVMEDRQGSYWLDDELIIHDCLVWDEVDELYDEVEDLPYYMPTKSQIAAYAGDSYYHNLPEAKNLLAFLDKIIPEDTPRREDLDFEIPYSCEQNWSPHQVAEMLMQYGFPFEDSEAASTFTRLYNALRQNTRQWALRGKTPWQHAADSGTSYPRFYLPSTKPRAVKKIGRNAPCPCGRGKKYKQCCGR